MQTRIQFRVDEETKRLAQKMAQSQGRTLSDACRALTEELAEAQRKVMAQNDWLKAQVDEAFAKYDIGESVFIDNKEAKTRLNKFKENIKSNRSE